jgi:hypothetical protein
METVAVFIVAFVSLYCPEIGPAEGLKNPRFEA